MYKFTIDDIQRNAQGRAVDILRDVAGIPADILDGDHHPCPKCGGKDRFRLIGKDRGAVFCNQCFNKKNGDFLAAVQWMKEVGLPEALDLIAEYLGLEPNPDQIGPADNTWRTVKEYIYTDESGEPAFKIERQENPSELTDAGKHPKRIRQYHKDGADWKYKLGADPSGKKRSFVPYPYRLDLIQSEEVRAVFICEGEKCVDALNELFQHSARRGEYIATTISGGSHNMKNWGLFDPYLGDLRIYFLPDNDEPGYKGAREAYTSLSAADGSREFYLLRLDRNADGDAAPPKYDVADWIEEQRARGEDLEQIAANFFTDLQSAVRVNSESAFDLPAAKPKEGIVILNFERFQRLEILPTETLFSPFLMKPSLSEIYAERGVGKTLFALAIAYGAACGGRLFGGGEGSDVPLWGAERPTRVLYLDGEMQAGEMQKRLDQIACGFLMDSHHLGDNDYFRIFNYGNYEAGSKNCDIVLNLTTEEGQTLIEPFVEEAELIIIDNLATLCRVRGSRSNDEESWSPMQEYLLKLRHRGKAVCFLHHAGKNGSQRGTSAKEDILDTVISLKRPGDYEAADGSRFILRFEKARGLYGENVVSLDCRARMEGAGLIWEARRIETTIQERVQELRGLEMSQKEIAAELGISTSKVCRILKKIKEANPE